MNFTDISCFLNKLKYKQKVLEKNGSDFIKSIDENYGIVLDENNISLKSYNELQLLTLKKEVQENYKILQELKTIVSPENIPKIDLLALKNKMLTLENSIHNIKNRIAKDMENLTKEENILSVDVTNLEIKYSDINRIKFEDRKIAVAPTNRKTENSSSYQEVEDFANFVNDNGGHEGGWSQNDHLLFLKYYHQIKSRKMLIKILQRFLPDFSDKKISSHIEWYIMYLSLREKQKTALEEWRRNKVKINKSSDVEENATSPVLKKKHNIELKRQNVKEKICKWKLEKQQKIQQETENRKQIESEKDKKTKNEKKMKREMKNELRNGVGKWRASKKAQETAEKLELEVMTLKEKEQKVMFANALIREFQKQDSLYIMRRINKHNRKTSNFFPPLPKESHKQYRDPERIFKATRQWLSRISSSDSNEYAAKSYNTLFSKGPLNVQQIPKLRIPTWRLAAN